MTQEQESIYQESKQTKDLVMDYREFPLSELLKNRKIFAVFDEEFQKGTWLDATALLQSESSINQLYRDGTVPQDTLDNIVERLSKK